MLNIFLSVAFLYSLSIDTHFKAYIFHTFKKNKYEGLPIHKGDQLKLFLSVYNYVPEDLF